MDIVKQMRALESDHEPDGWPAVQMKQISALCDEIERLQSKIDAANAQPVCEVVQLNQDRYLSLTCVGAVKPKVGDKLYARPIPAQLHDVEREELIRLIEAVRKWGVDHTGCEPSISCFHQAVDNLRMALDNPPAIPAQQSPAEVPADCLSPTVRSSRRYGEPTARHMQSPAVAVPAKTETIAKELSHASVYLYSYVEHLERLLSTQSPRITEPVIPKGFVLWPENLTFDMITAYESAILGPISTLSGEGYLRMLNVVKSQFNNALRSASSQCSLRITEQDAYDIILNFYWYMEEFKNKHGRNPSLIEWRDAGGRALLNNLNNGVKS